MDGFVDALAVAESDCRWLVEIPDFAAEVQRIFEPWEIAEYLRRSRPAARDDASRSAAWEWAKDILLQDSDLLDRQMGRRRTTRRTGVR
jgi:hypothetical protein